MPSPKRASTKFVFPMELTGLVRALHSVCRGSHARETGVSRRRLLVAAPDLDRSKPVTNGTKSLGALVRLAFLHNLGKPLSAEGWRSKTRLGFFTVVGRERMNPNRFPFAAPDLGGPICDQGRRDPESVRKAVRFGPLPSGNHPGSHKCAVGRPDEGWEPRIVLWGGSDWRSLAQGWGNIGGQTDAVCPALAC